MTLPYLPFPDITYFTVLGNAFDMFFIPFTLSFLDIFVLLPSCSLLPQIHLEGSLVLTPIPPPLFCPSVHFHCTFFSFVHSPFHTFYKEIA